MFAALSLLALVTGATASDTHSCIPKYNDISTDPITAPESFSVRFYTSEVSEGVTNAPIEMTVTRSWAPLGVDRFYSLIQDNYYNCAAFFRVVPDFVVQYGIAAEPAETEKWNTPIADDPVLKSNSEWTVTYATAGPDTRTTQIFINYVNNDQLDEQGFAPFGIVTSGFDTALSIVNPTPDSSNGISQPLYTKGGNEWLLGKYPNTTLITKVELVED
jgi:cyclophilin family peptidyl-prolyl cis-trans isomerase